MHKGIVITHPERGIYVGEAILCFWSMWDAAGQSSVATFADEAQAREYASQWTDIDPSEYEYVAVETAAETSATIDELKAAGLEDKLGDLLSSLANVPVYGHG